MVLGKESLMMKLSNSCEHAPGFVGSSIPLQHPARMTGKMMSDQVDQSYVLEIGGVQLFLFCSCIRCAMLCSFVLYRFLLCSQSSLLACFAPFHSWLLISSNSRIGERRCDQICACLCNDPIVHPL